MTKRRARFDDLGFQVLRYLIEQSEGVGRSVPLVDFFRGMNGIRAYDIRVVMSELIADGYADRDDHGTDERFEKLVDVEWALEGGLTLENALLPMSLTRAGLLHYIELERASNALRLSSGQVFAFWVLFGMSALQTLTALREAQWWPFTPENVTQTQSTVIQSATLPDSASTDAVTRIDVLCGACDTATFRP